MIVAAIFVVFPFCLAFSALSDALTMTIPNRVPVILMATFAIVAPLAGLGLSEIAIHIAMALAVFGLCFGLFALGTMGGGDAKLLTACALWFGADASLLEFLLSVSLFGGLLTVAILLLRAREDFILSSRLPIPRLLFTANKIPYGIAIAAGGFVAYPSSPLVQLALSSLH